jgi:hypothetical protein
MQQKEGNPAMIRHSIAGIAITCLLLNSCSLYPISPTVRLEPPNVSPVELIRYDPSDESLLQAPVTQISECEKKPLIPTRECEVARALGYAQQANTLYLKAQGQYEELPAVVGLVTIPIAAASLALGIQGEGGAPVTGLGVAAATAMGVGSFLQNKDRESVYTTGAEGIQCLIANMEPYTRVPSTDLSLLDWDLHSTFITGSYKGNLQDLNDAKDEIEARINAVEALGLQKLCTKPLPIRRYASLLLKAAKAADKAAGKAAQVGDDFLRTAQGAPNTIVNVTNQINNAVNANLIKTEPDIQKLSSNLKGAIPDQATDLAGINSLKTSAADAKKAQNAAASAATGAGLPAPKAEEGVLMAEETAAGVSGTTPATSKSADMFKESPSQSPTGAPSGVTAPQFNLNWRQTLILPRAVPTPPPPSFQDIAPQANTAARPRKRLIPDGMTETEFYALRDLQTSVYRVNLKVSEVTRVAGTATGTVDNGKCPILAKKAGEVKALTLNPDGDIVVAPGAKTTITLQGTTDPYVRPLFSQNMCNAVTATLKGNTMDVAATGDTVAGFYPFFVGDGPTGRPIDVMVSKSSKDTGDDVNMDCHDIKTKKPPSGPKIVCPSSFPGPLLMQSGVAAPASSTDETE